MKITVVSTAHSEEDIDSTIEASYEVFKELSLRFESEEFKKCFSYPGDYRWERLNSYYYVSLFNGVDVFH